MTEQEVKLKIGAIRMAERREIDRVRQQSLIDQQKVLNEWAKEHAICKIGNIITSQSITIRVERIVGQLGLDNKPFVRYDGLALTKQLKERADGWITSIYDDNPDRNIVKIK